MENFTVAETSVFLQAADDKDLVILACTVYDWSTRVTDRRTDRQTELRWLRRATAAAAVARKNWFTFSKGEHRQKFGEMFLA